MFNALVLSTGGSPEPLIKCIYDYQPDFVYFLHSEDSLKIAKEVIEKTGFNKNYEFKLINDSDNLQESFVKSREIIKKLKDKNYMVSIDFTGGTKPMVSGLVLAAIGENCNYSYVGAMSKEGRNKNGVGIVKNGFESIKSQKDPYNIYAIFEFDRGIGFFNNYQFNASKKNFKEAESKLENETLKELSHIYLNMVDLYSTWDLFNNTMINGKTQLHRYLKTEILEKILNNSNLEKKIKEDNPDLIIQIENNIKFLEKKISKRNKTITKDINYYLPDLLNNALRRIEELKYDDAIGRLYRSIELIAQINITNLGLIDENILRDNHEFRINKNILEEKIDLNTLNEIKYWEEYSSESNTLKLALNKSYGLLDLWGVDFASKYLNDKKFKNYVQKRNSSILAHGIEPISKEDAETLYELVFNYAKDSCPDIVYYMNLAKFPKLI